MANVNKLIFAILHHEASLSENYLHLEPSKQFDIAKLKGWSDDKLDLGGATMCGVTLRSYAAYCSSKGLGTPTKVDLKNISFEHWLDILKTMYWDKCKADLIDNQSIANLIVDWYYNSGNWSAKRVQRLLGLSEDGIVGNKTITAINEAEQIKLFNDIKKSRIEFVSDICKRNSSQKRFFNGWLKRINYFTI